MSDDNPIDVLLGMIRSGDIAVRIGLTQQGHIPTIERMLSEGATWEDIGNAIGWHGPTAKRWYEAEMKAKKSQ